MSAREILLACVGLLASSCVEEQRYAVMNEQVEMIGNEAPAFFNDDDEPVFVVDRRFEFQIEPPSDARLQQLTDGVQGTNLPFPRLPWVEDSDIDLQLDYSIENRGTARIVVDVILDGINEFHEYTPGPEDFSQWERRIALEPGERVSGSVSEFEMSEIAVDLATVVNGAPNSNLVVQHLSQSTRDERVQPYIPPVIPGLVGVRAGIRSGQAQPLVLELSVRVQDHGDRVPSRGQPRWELPTPMAFTPVVVDEGT